MSREGGTLAFSVPKLPGFLSFRKEPLPCPLPVFSTTRVAPLPDEDCVIGRLSGGDSALRGCPTKYGSAPSLWTHTCLSYLQPRDSQSRVEVMGSLARPSLGEEMSWQRAGRVEGWHR